jgi:hypothetical protein
VGAMIYQQKEKGILFKQPVTAVCCCDPIQSGGVYWVSVRELFIRDFFCGDIIITFTSDFLE